MSTQLIVAPAAPSGSVAPPRGRALRPDVCAAGSARAADGEASVRRPQRPSRSAPRTLADAVSSAVARGRLEAAVAALQDVLLTLEQRRAERAEALSGELLALSRQAFGRVTATLRAVCGRDSRLPAAERQALSAEFGRRVQDAIARALAACGASPPHRMAAGRRQLVVAEPRRRH